MCCRAPTPTGGCTWTARRRRAPPSRQRMLRAAAWRHSTPSLSSPAGARCVGPGWAGPGGVQPPLPWGGYGLALLSEWCVGARCRALPPVRLSPGVLGVLPLSARSIHHNDLPNTTEGGGEKVWVCVCPGAPQVILPEGYLEGVYCEMRAEVQAAADLLTVRQPRHDWGASRGLGCGGRLRLPACMPACMHAAGVRACAHDGSCFLGSRLLPARPPDPPASPCCHRLISGLLSRGGRRARCAWRTRCSAGLGAWAAPSGPSSCRAWCQTW